MRVRKCCGASCLGSSLVSCAAQPATAATGARGVMCCFPECSIPPEAVESVTGVPPSTRIKRTRRPHDSMQPAASLQGEAPCHPSCSARVLRERRGAKHHARDSGVGRQMRRGVWGVRGGGVVAVGGWAPGGTWGPRVSRGAGGAPRTRPQRGRHPAPPGAPAAPGPAPPPLLPSPCPLRTHTPASPPAYGPAHPGPCASGRPRPAAAAEGTSAETSPCLRSRHCTSCAHPGKQ